MEQISLYLIALKAKALTLVAAPPHFSHTSRELLRHDATQLATALRIMIGHFRSTSE